YGPFATSASRSRLRLPRTTRLALRASLAGSERWNNTLRQHLSRFVRKTLSFSKCVKMHEICLKLFLHRYNTE
ncbi:MAG: hypothetical protein, partial [Olavius algarvensis Gamma 1 endosymbiont]